MARFAPVYMTVYDGIVVGALTLSAATFVDDDVEDTAIGTISGMSDSGSVLTIDPPDGRVKIINDDELVVGADAAVAGDFDITVRETYPNTTIDTKDTVLTITVTAA